MAIVVSAHVGCGDRTGLLGIDDPKASFTGVRASAVSAGYFHTHAVTAGGGVECWGNNNVCDPGDDHAALSSLVPRDDVGPRRAG
jgi:hypothetical protein